MGEIEGGSIRLAPLELRHPLLDTTALQQQIYSHYMRTAIPELVKLVGSANLLGRHPYAYRCACMAFRHPAKHP